jgi:hypothetical protein
MQIAIHSALTTRIILNIRNTAGSQHGEQSELHMSYLEMPVVAPCHQWLVSDEYSQEQATRAIALQPVYSKS